VSRGGCGARERARTAGRRFVALNICRFVTLLLAALALTMESAHVLELPQKLAYDAQLYTAVNGTLYRWFAIVGGGYQLGSIAAAVLLAYLSRNNKRSFPWTLGGALALVVAFGVWLAVVQPVNLEVADVQRSAPDSLPVLWARLRGRWEWGHAAGFVIQLVAYCALLASVLVELRRLERRRAERRAQLG
jgi:hypothetical protein